MERGDRGGGLLRAGLGRGWEEEGTTRETGAWLGSGAVTSAQKKKNLAGKCARWQRGVRETVGWERGDLYSSPSNATWGWVTLGKSPDLSEPQLQGEGNRPRQSKVSEPGPSPMLRTHWKGCPTTRDSVRG